MLEYTLILLKCMLNEHVFKVNCDAKLFWKNFEGKDNLTLPFIRNNRLLHKTMYLKTKYQ